MKLVIVGGKGMLGTDLVAVCGKAGVESVVLDLPELDICDLKNVRRNLTGGDWVVNCAAFTRVDDAEKEQDAALAVNATGAGHVAKVCEEKGLKLIHISTDYVFDGKKGSPYSEDDPTSPLNYYGFTKLKGEEAVRAAGGHALIVRTESLYGLNGRSFIRAILQKVKDDQKTLHVVYDQISSPTYTRHLADALVRLCRLDKTGLVNVAASGSCSWFEFAREIVKRVRPGIKVLPLTTAALNFPALRPAFSVLDTSRYTSWTGHTMPSWESGLEQYLAEDPLAAALR